MEPTWELFTVAVSLQSSPSTSTEFNFRHLEDFMEKQDAEYNIVKVARHIRLIESSEEDSLRLEIR